MLVFFGRFWHFFLQADRATMCSIGWHRGTYFARWPETEHYKRNKSTLIEELRRGRRAGRGGALRLRKHICHPCVPRKVKWSKDPCSQSWHLPISCFLRNYQGNAARFAPGDCGRHKNFPVGWPEKNRSKCPFAQGAKSASKAHQKSLLSVPPLLLYVEQFAEVPKM